MVKFPSRIALFLRYLGGGGAERVMLNLARGLLQYGVKVDLVLGKAWGPHLEKIPPEVQLVDLGASGLLSTTLALSQYLRREKPVALLSGLHYTNEIAVWARHLAGIPTQLIVSEHNTFSQAIKHTPKTKRYLLPFFVRHFYPWADSIIAVSRGVASDLAHSTGLPIDKIQVIYNPVITPELLEKAKKPLDHPWFEPGEPPVILGVGKLEAQKDFSNLIRAFAQVRKARPSRLMILGWGSERPKLEALVEKLGLEKDVALLGYVDNPYAYMARASMFVLSSAWEGLPTVLVEAMALSIPVVSTDCKSGPAEILDGGNYGILTPVGDSQALSEAILAVLAGKSKQVDPNWLKQFEMDTSVQQYLKAIAS